jgi:hypothetical protein
MGLGHEVRMAIHVNNVIEIARPAALSKGPQFLG